ncbi:MAG: gliding motility-associated C-terminal domain-containing protein [Bacteroidia bacterium]|jgi:gliding motility-associated-like protein|nr:gliding motility-associated C-terminal domain-containing protein [Bacteroidia bacterium]
MKCRPGYITIILLFFNFCVSAQNGVWTWMGGDTIANPTGNFGIQGVPAPTNRPPGVYEAAEWTDLNGNFWVFGGFYQGPNGGYNSSLWRYEPATNNWTWMKGPPTLQMPGVYGIQGIPSPLNYPSGRAYGVTTWTDLNGNLWMFGGGGLDATATDNILNELWTYNVATNEWTWMGGSPTGSSPGSYGQITVPSATNWPPSKYETAVSWVDNNGDLWMFGGLSSAGSSDDVWRYTISTASWTWMSGQQLSSTSLPVPPNYGQLGVPAPSNTPGSRWVYNGWKDLQGRFWLFGGNALASSTAAFPADMWMYDPATLLWTWMAGVQTDNDSATFLATCVPGGLPSGCFEDRACWTDPCGRFWSISTGAIIVSSHLWVFDPVSLQFTWITGSLGFAPPPVYGIQGVPSPTNYPDGVFGGNAFVSLQGELWLFGGIATNSFGTTNNLWRYQPDPLCLGVPNFTTTATADSTGCAPFTMQFGTSGNAAVTYQWDFGDPLTTLDTSSIAAPTYIYSTPGTYTATLITNYGPCGDSPDTSFAVIQVLQSPVVNLGNDTLLCPGQTLLLDAQNSGTSYIWNTGATSQSISVTDPGTYTVAVSNQSCIDADTITVSSIQTFELTNNVSLCGLQNGLVLDAGNPGSSYLWSTGETTQTISIQQAGSYWVTITNPPCILSDTITVNGILGEGLVYIPNSFTPNGDGLNDRFTGIGENFTTFHLLIFNRWGELIFETRNQSGWDGQYQGEIAKGDVYVYKLSYSNICTGEQVIDRLGHVTLIR